MTSCSLPAVTPTASVIGATASVTSAYLDITDEDEITVYTKECLWFRQIPKLTKEEKAALRRSTKEAILANKMKHDKFCVAKDG